MKSTQQPDLLRYCDAALANAYREAADTERRNPYYAPDEAEKRAKHYESKAQALETHSTQRNAS